MNDLPADDRTISPVSAKKGLLRSPKAKRTAMLVGAAAAVCFAGLALHSALHPAVPPEKADDSSSAVLSQVTTTPPPPPPPAAPEPVRTAPPPPPVAAAAPAVVAPPKLDYVRLPTSSGETDFAVPEPTKVAAADGGDKSDPPGQPDRKRSDETKVVFKPSTIEGAKAGPAMDLTYVMMPQFIPCALDTAMDSTVAGAIMCHTTRDVLSPMHVLLMPAHTQIMGTYKNDVRQGQNRLFAFVGSAITKEGIPVPLNSQVSDGMGRAGVPGEVDNHFWSRFGAGILLSGSEEAMQLAQALASKGGNSYFSLNTGSTTSVATQILEQQEQQQPTVTVTPGTVISIVVDHPISFADALRVTTR